MKNIQRLRNIVPEYLTILSILSIIICALLVESNNILFASLVTIVLSIILGLQSVPVALCLVMMLIPSSRSVEAFGISGAVRLTFFCTLTNIIKRKKYERKLILISLIYLLYCQQYLIRFGDIRLSIIMPMKIVIVVLLYSNLEDYSIKKLDLDSFIYSANTALFIGIVSSILPSIIKGTGTRLSVINNDPNMLAVECVFSLSIYLNIYFVKNKLSKIFFILSSITLIIITIFCGSRMGIVLLIFVFFSSMVNIFKFDKSILNLLILAFLIYIFVNTHIGQSVIQNIIFRNKALISQKNFNNGRLDIWLDYFNTLNSNKWLWLIGLGDYRYYNLENMAHNFIIEDIAGNGLIGLFIQYYLFFCSFKKITRKFNVRISEVTLYSLVPFLVPIIGALTLHGLGSLPNYSMLFLGVLTMVQNYNNTSK